jgi:hypothetical protein
MAEKASAIFDRQSMPPRSARIGRRLAQPSEAFASFFERNTLRDKRRRSRRNMIIISLVVHALALAAVVVYSMWDTDELWAPSVGVKMFSRSAPPPGVHLPPTPPTPAAH